MQTLFESNDISFMTKILNNKHFSFIYNKNEIKTGEKEFRKPG